MIRLIIFLLKTGKGVQMLKTNVVTKYMYIKCELSAKLQLENQISHFQEEISLT